MATIKKDPLVFCFGDAVVQVREEAKMSTEELAKRTGIPLKLLRQIEEGTATGNDFGLDEICKLAEAVKVRPSGVDGHLR